MSHKRLARGFFNRPTLTVAEELLGKFLVRKIGPTSSRLRRARSQIVAALITETEAYCGPDDLASHASHGRTKRAEVMFGPPGHAYVYLIYGMYHCFNIVTGKENYPAAVLIRGVALVIGNKLLVNGKTIKPTTKNQQLTTNLNGPGKLCRYFQIDKSLNNEDLTTSKKLWLEDRGTKIKPNLLKRSPRIGVDYAGSYKNKPWRFVLKN